MRNAVVQGVVVMMRLLSVPIRDDRMYCILLVILVRKDHRPNKLGLGVYGTSFSHGFVHESRTVNSDKTVQEICFFRLLTDSTERTQRIRSRILHKGVLIVNDFPTVALYAMYKHRDCMIIMWIMWQFMYFWAERQRLCGS